MARKTRRERLLAKLLQRAIDNVDLFTTSQEVWQTDGVRESEREQFIQATLWLTGQLEGHMSSVKREFKELQGSDDE